MSVSLSAVQPARWPSRLREVLRSIAERRIQAIEEDHALDEHLLVILERGQEAANGQINASRLISGELLILEVHLVDDLGQVRQTPIALPEAFDQRLERAILALMPELDSGRVKGNRVGWKVLRGSKNKLRVRIDEPLDQPRRSDPVHMGAGTRDPASPLE